VVHRPALLLADEPTGNLDAAYAAEIGELFRSFNQVGATVVIATHDHQLADRLEPRLVTIAEGRVDALPAAATASFGAGPAELRGVSGLSRPVDPS
jgi:cell division transport system ATP-binding protein